MKQNELGYLDLMKKSDGSLSCNQIIIECDNMAHLGSMLLPAAGTTAGAAWTTVGAAWTTAGAAWTTVGAAWTTVGAATATTGCSTATTAGLGWM